MTALKLTTYVDRETHEWLCAYANRVGLKRSELIKLLILREKRNHWLEKAMDLPDPHPVSPDSNGSKT
mgnify:CR=1 FL=1